MIVDAGRPASPTAIVTDTFRWDDRTWEQVWDHLLGPNERHDIVRSVWHRTIPDRPLEARVAIEFAQRWRRRVVQLTVLWGLWVAFWLLMLRVEMIYRPGPGVLLPAGLALLGVGAITFCWYARARARSVATAYEGTYEFADPTDPDDPPG